MENFFQMGAFTISLLIFLFILIERRSAAKRNEKLKERISASEKRIEYLEKLLDKTEKTMRDEMGLSRAELSNSIKGLSDSLISRINEMSKLQHMQSDSMDSRMARLVDTNEEKLEAMRKELESKLNNIIRENSEKLEAMRLTVDEKL
ncbi:MAG: DNA recombination protein RmuC, partial [Clostridiales bacterium]|nr:DNA recombination protein RmuC [Clostridiales bacterium]